MADVERGLISKVIYSGGMAEVLKAGVNGRFFHDLEHAGVWEWMVNHWNRYGISPDREAIRYERPEYELTKTAQPLQYYLERVMASHKRAEAVELHAEVNTLLHDGEIDDALSVMADGVIEINKATTLTEDEDVISTWNERLGRWAAIKERGDVMVGIPTGFDFIDRATGGWQKEQFVVLIGPQKSGKSSIALSSAIAASNAGYSVVFVSFEMSNLEQEARHDALRAGFNPNLLLWGKTTSRQDEQLRRALKRVENMPPIHFVHDMGARSLSSAIAKVHQYKPDLVVVDGMYLMDAEIPGVESIDTRALTKISRSFKVLAQTLKVPVFGTHQALDAKWNAKRGLTTSAAGYTSAFGQDCDVMLGIEPVDEENIAKLRIITGRNVGRHLAFISFDWDHGMIEEREEWKGGDDEEGDDA